MGCTAADGPAVGSVIKPGKGAIDSGQPVLHARRDCLIHALCGQRLSSVGVIARLVLGLAILHCGRLGVLEQPLYLGPLSGEPGPRHVLIHLAPSLSRLLGQALSGPQPPYAPAAARRSQWWPCRPDGRDATMARWHAMARAARALAVTAHPARSSASGRAGRSCRSARPGRSCPSGLRVRCSRSAPSARSPRCCRSHRRGASARYCRPLRAGLSVPTGPLSPRRRRTITCIAATGQAPRARVRARADAVPDATVRFTRLTG